MVSLLAALCGDGVTMFNPFNFMGGGGQLNTDDWVTPAGEKQIRKLSSRGKQHRWV